MLRIDLYRKIGNKEPYKSGYWGIANCIYFTIYYGKTRVDVHITTVTDFNQRVGLGNSYCNCFHLIRRVEKSTWYIFLKRALLS